MMTDEKALGFSIAAEIRLKHGKLYTWLKEKGLTNVDLGRMTGITSATIGLYVWFNNSLPICRRGNGLHFAHGSFTK